MSKTLSLMGKALTGLTDLRGVGSANAFLTGSVISFSFFIMCLCSTSLSQIYPWARWGEIRRLVVSHSVQNVIISQLYL